VLGLPVARVVPSPRLLAYRARVTFRVHADGRLGYHRPRSHDWEEIPACALARPELSAVRARLPHLPGLERVELRTDGDRVVLVGTGPARMRGLLRRLKVTGLSGAALGRRTVSGETNLCQTVGGITHTLSPSTFFQVNPEVNAALVDAVGAHVRALQPAGLLDLYGGAGNLSFPLASAGVPLVLIERSRDAIADARLTAERHGLTVDLRAADADRFRAGDAFFDVALLDPPRRGAPGVLEQLLTTRPRAVLYVSCSPHALRRDLRPARSAGYRVTSLELFDMFPQTGHMELLCVLRRD